MQKSLFFIIVLLFFISCQNKGQDSHGLQGNQEIVAPVKKLYAYNLVLNDYDYSNNPKITYLEPEIIEAENDSIAYCIAIQKFYVRIYASKMTEAHMKKRNLNLGNVAYPKLFVLHTSEGKDISDGLFLSDPLKMRQDRVDILEKIHQRKLDELNNRND